VAGQEFDYVVVGGGSAGAALAARLSEREDRTVALLEAGSRDSHPFIHVPSFVAAAIGTKSLNWRFETVPQPGMAGRRIGVPRGRVIGGSGAINGMVYFRGHPTDFDAWADMGAKGWSYRDVLPYFTRNENNENFPASVYHGRGGPVNVKYPAGDKANPLNRAYLDALASLQFKHCPDFNGPDPEGYGYRQGLIRDGRRESTARSMLWPAVRSRRNIEVITNAQAARILLDGRRATGIKLVDGREIKARAEVILCAGAIQTPQLLLLSGIGPAEHLMKVGIDIVHDLPGVGGNYHDHVACPVHMETDDPDSYGISWKVWPRDILAGIQYLLTRTGPLASNVFESVAFLKTDPSLSKPDVQFVFQPAKRLTNPKIPFPLGHGYAISPVALYPKSRGTLRLASNDPTVAPLIDPRLLAEKGDIDPLMRAVKIARRAFAAPSFAKYQGVEVAPGPDVQSDDEIEAFIRGAAYTVHHPGGTARMGAVNDQMSVVDPDLRVIGIEGLRVADASVFPLVVGGNTNAAAVMVGERGADKVLGKPDLPPAELPPESVGRKS
jgi:choline dehydrogenase-like flavoprotein